MGVKFQLDAGKRQLAWRYDGQGARDELTDEQAMIVAVALAAEGLKAISEALYAVGLAVKEHK